MAIYATEFRSRIKSWVPVLAKKAAQEMNHVTLSLYRNITTDENFPVDTGAAQSSFAISLNEPGDYLPPEVSRRGRKKGDARILHPKPAEAFEPMLKSAPLDAKRIVYSNLEYLRYIEWGSAEHEGFHSILLAVQKLVAGDDVGAPE